MNRALRADGFALTVSLCANLMLATVTAANAQASRPTVAQLTKRAELIAFGHCEAAESNWDEQHRLIVTSIRFRPSRSFKGAATDRLTIKILGGQIGNHGMSASHGAAMIVGEEAVLLLQHSNFGDYYVITGGADGKLPVRPDPTSGRPMIRGALSLDDFGRWVSRLTRAP